MHTENMVYHHNGRAFNGFLAYDPSITGKRPTVLIAHAWAGRDEFPCEKAKMLAKLGYVGFAMDVYGEGKVGKSIEENSTLMTPLMENRQLLRDRLSAAFTHVKTLKMVDENNIAAMGYCFGGLCVLDMARAGLNLKGALSFHGLLFAPENIPNQKIKAKILALHGHEDPMVPPSQVAAFENEMTDAKADWQVHVYGNTKHAFTNPEAHDAELGLIYDATAASRAHASMLQFFKEIFAASSRA